MMVRNSLFALAAAGAAFASTSLAVAPAAASSGIDGLAVRHADLNLSSPIGRAALDRRIAFAADQVCGDVWTDQLVMQRLARTCQANVIAGAQAQRDALLRGERLAAIVVRRADA